MESKTQQLQYKKALSRIKKIFIATELALLGVAFQRIFFEGIGLNEVVLLVSAIILIPLYFYTQNDNLNRGSELFLLIMTVLFCYLMWANDGARDEVTFAFPALICFAAALGHKRALLVIFAIFVINIAGVGLANDLGWITHRNSGNSLSSSFIIITIFAVVAYTIGQIVADLSKANRKLQMHREMLESKVIARTSELEHSILQLQEMQNQLIETEKMASLGRLVAGVAHEINTPVGIGITATSCTQDDLLALQESFERDKLTKSQMRGYLKSALENNALAASSLNRAGDLIGNFKQAAVEQTSINITHFSLSDLVNDLEKSFQTQLAKFNVTFNHIQVNHTHITSSYGALIQVFSNLIVNSMTHGFANRQSGEITITSSVQDQAITLIYRDNGVGMTEQVKAHVFEPFFTTQRSKGNSGLGMHIVFNLITYTLNGQISVESAPNEGVTYTLTLPLNKNFNAPEGSLPH